MAQTYDSPTPSRQPAYTGKKAPAPKPTKTPEATVKARVMKSMGGK